MRSIPLACALAAISYAAEPLVLVENGRSTYSICLSSQASPSEKRGAEELQRFLSEMSGARLPVISDAVMPPGDLILVGRGKLTDSLKLNIPFGKLGDEGFALRTSGRHLVIAGGRLRGTMYGVYGFLDKLGCRWFTREVSRIPKMATLRVGPLDETQRPAFEYREPFFTEAFEKNWAARNRVNGASMKLDESTGGKVTYNPFVHSFNLMIPAEKYFRLHPEYFSLIEGRRRAERGQLCLTNPALLRESVKNVLGWIQEHPEAKIISVSQNDWVGWCECDNCQRVEAEEGGVHSGPLLRFVNALAAEIEKKHPDKLIDTLAYMYTEDPPAKVKPRPNVRIRLCPMGACQSHPYEKCPRNAYFMKNLRAWSKITNQLYIWHYNTDFSHYLQPFPNFDELAADIPMYKRYGVVGLFLQGAYPPGGGGENAELRSYVMARLLWDPHTDADREVNDFLAAVYGRAAGHMRAYYDWMHQQVRFPPLGRGHHLYISNPPQAPYLSRGFLDRAEEIFRQAAAAADDETIRRRVTQAKLSIDYVRLMQDRQYLVGNGEYAPADLGGIKARFQGLWNLIRGYGIVSIREGSDLKQDEETFHSLIKAYKVATIENRVWRVDVVPELNGRIIRMIDKHGGRDDLYHPDPGERRYPNLGGLSLSLYPDFHTGKAYDITWEVDASSASDRLVLNGTTANGLKLRRLIGFTADGGMAHTGTVVTNAGSAATPATIQSLFQIDTGDLEETVVRYARADGTVSATRLLEPERDAAGTEDYLDANMPNGEWAAVSTRLGRLWKSRFPRQLAGRGWMNWNAKDGNRITFGLWSKQRTLKPGETLSLEADYGMEALTR